MDSLSYEYSDALFIGRQVEAVFGSLNFSLIYILSGIFGNAATFIFSPNSLSAGASTSIFGLLQLLQELASLQAIRC